MHRAHRALAALTIVLGTAGCVDSSAGGGATTDGGRITVESTATDCRLSDTTTTAGPVTFAVTNAGTDVTEFYLLAEDGVRVVAEVESIGPGLTRELVAQVNPGTYWTACKPGMVGDGIRTELTVTGAAPDSTSAGSAAHQVAAAEQQYRTYVVDQVDALVAGTQAFATAYTAGDDDRARALYAPTRMHWERVEPVAESFGNLDPLLDLREADLAPGQPWTGWHLIEKDLWPPAAPAEGSAATALTPAQRAVAAQDLVTHTQELADRVHDPAFTLEAFQISNGAKELLDEVATGKITGEEEAWSHTDLSDVQANVDGARAAFDALRAVATARDPDLVATLDTRFTALQDLLTTHGDETAGFPAYDELSAADVRALSAAVDAVSEPLSRLTVTVTGA